MEFYKADDKTAMNDNNSSAYNARPVAGRSSGHSLHAYGLAIDINPVQNPFHHFENEEDKAKGLRSTAPIQSAILYINRIRAQADQRPGLAEYVVDVFRENGFTIWGGNWDDPIDWQHFQTSRGLAQLLTEMVPEDAEVFFEMHAKHPRMMTDISASDVKTFITAYQKDAREFMKMFRDNTGLLLLEPQKALDKFKQVTGS